MLLPTLRLSQDLPNRIYHEVLSGLIICDTLDPAIQGHAPLYVRQDS